MKILPHVAFMESVQTTETGPLLPSALMPQSWEMTFEWSCVAAPLPRFPPASMSTDPSDPPFPLSRPRRKTPGSDFRTFWGYQRPSGFNMDCINLYTVYICIPICHVWIPFRLWSLRASFDIRHILALSLSLPPSPSPRVQSQTEGEGYLALILVIFSSIAKATFQQFPGTQEGDP
jgi:hypothetical protein